MASEVQICNEGLAFIGVPAILTLGDNSKPARQCNLIYTSKRDELLRSHEWKFATKRTNLSPTTTAPAFGWDYAFNIPSDCLKLLYVGDSDGNRREYSLELNQILTNNDLIYIKYTKRIESPDSMDALFRATLSMYIAQHVAKPLGAKSDYQRAVEEYETKLSDARFNGSIEAGDEYIEATSWLESRY